jgi:hypothetical protein
MGAPFAREPGRERPRDWLAEAYLVATVARVADPLALPVAEFTGYLEAAARGDLRRVAGPIDTRAYIDSLNL